MGTLDDLQKLPSFRHRKASLVMAAFHVEYPYNQSCYRFTSWRPKDRAFVAVCVAAYRHRPGRVRRAMRWPIDAERLDKPALWSQRVRGGPWHVARVLKALKKARAPRMAAKRGGKA